MLRSIVSRVFTVTELSVSKYGQRLIHTNPMLVASKVFLKPTLRPLGSIMQIHDTKAKGEEELFPEDILGKNKKTETPPSQAEINKNAQIVSENATLLARAREYEDKYLRALAETENVRTRLTKQIQDAKLFAIQGFCKDMTEIEEILRMAVDSVPKDQVNGDNKHLKNLYEGLSMTSARLLQVFKIHGLTPFNPIDKKFNPNEHEAVVVQEVEGKESGSIIFVSKFGYKLNDRVIKPAIVGVAK